MKVVAYHSESIEAKDPKLEGAKGVLMRVVIGKEIGARNFIMRIFEISPGGHTPYHRHDFEHENYIISGEGELVTEEGAKKLYPGYVAYVPPNEYHQYKNTGKETLKLICLIPSM